MSIPMIVSTFALAFFYFWPSIPSGLALGLSPLVVIITTALSYIAGVVLVLLLDKPVQQWLLRRFNKTVDNPGSLLRRACNRFGIIGLGLVAPVTVGAQIGVVIGLALNAPPRKLWSIVPTVAVSVGLIGIRSIT